MKKTSKVVVIFSFVFLVFYVLFSNLFPIKHLADEKTSNTPRTNHKSSPSEEVISKENQNPIESPIEGILVERVIDGDTIEIEGGVKVRYIGIDTPETVDPRTSVQCYGKEAAVKNRELVEGKRVRLEKDLSETDKYGRWLRYVYINNTLINEALVSEGYAFSSPYPPDVKYQERFNSAEKFARENSKGLWGSCESVAGTKTTVPSTDCAIKGNISSSGKIYHVPGQRYYNQTVITESKGERWFCTEEEAQKAGWRKSKV